MTHIMDEHCVDLFNSSPELLTTEEVERILRVSTTTVVRWTKEDRLRSIKVGPRFRRYPKDALKRYLREAAFQGTNN